MSQLEAGKHDNPELDTVRGLAKAFDCTVADVLVALDETINEASRVA